MEGGIAMSATGAGAAKGAPPPADVQEARPVIHEGVGGPLQERAWVEAPPDPTDAADASASSSSRPSCGHGFQQVAVHKAGAKRLHPRSWRYRREAVLSCVSEAAGGSEDATEQAAALKAILPKEVLEQLRGFDDGSDVHKYK
jgi:hypothetical protein